MVWPEELRTWIIGDGYFANSRYDPNYLGNATDQGFYMGKPVPADDITKIQQEGKLKRYKAEQELAKIDEEMKGRLYLASSGSEI